MSRRLQSKDLQKDAPQIRDLISVGSLKGLNDALKKTTYPFYGILLPSPQDSQVNRFIQHQWDTLHAMSGEGCLLLTTLAPEHPTEQMRLFLQELVGKKRGQTLWRRYTYLPGQLKNDTFLLAQQAHIDFDRLPCLVLMTDLDSRQQLLHRLPDWNEASLYQFFSALFTRVHRHTGETDPARRLKELEKELGKAFVVQLHLNHIRQSTQEKLEDLNWAEIIQSTFTNQDLIASIFKLLAARYVGPA